MLVRGERGREIERDVEELFLPMCGSQAYRPLIPLTLTPLLLRSQRHVSLYLPIAPSINLHLPSLLPVGSALLSLLLYRPTHDVLF